MKRIKRIESVLSVAYPLPPRLVRNPGRTVPIASFSGLGSQLFVSFINSIASAILPSCSS